MRFAWAMAIVLCIGGSGCGGKPFRRTERSIQARLSTVIGPADHYEVRLSRSTAGALRGRLRWLEIRGEKVEVVKDLKLDELAIRLEDVRFNRESGRLQEIGRAQFVAGITGDSVTEYLRRKASVLGEVEVRFTRGRMQIRIRPDFFDPEELPESEAPIEIEGRPVLHGEKEIHWEASRIAVLRHEVPESLLRELEGVLNPLIDLEDARFPLRLSQIRIDHGRVVVAGLATLSPEIFRRRLPDADGSVAASPSSSVVGQSSRHREATAAVIPTTGER